jgi:hypothetical protein
MALANQHLDHEALAQFEEVLRRAPYNQVALAHAKVLRADLTGVPPNR